MTPDLVEEARRLVESCRARGALLATAESCTGGLVAGLLTDIAGSSAVFDRGFVTYSNAAKQEMLGVPADLLDGHGAVSEPCARAMADGALARSSATIAVAITGIAGPGGGSPDKPVGLVHFGCARRDGPTIHAEFRFGALGRAAIRTAAVAQALRMIAAALDPAA